MIKLTENHYFSQRDFLDLLAGKSLDVTQRKNQRQLEMPVKKEYVERAPKESAAPIEDLQDLNKRVADIIATFRTGLNNHPLKPSENNTKIKLSIPEIARALEIDAKKILKIKDQRGSWEICFQPSVIGDRAMQNHLDNYIVPKLRELDIDSYFFSYDIMNYLAIKEDYVNKFIQYVNDCNSPPSLPDSPAPTL